MKDVLSTSKGPADLRCMQFSFDVFGALMRDGGIAIRLKTMIMFLRMELSAAHWLCVHNVAFTATAHQSCVDA